MPSGYTADIYEGKEVNGKDFIMKCARAFGATVMMRDDPLDKEIPEFQPSTFYLERLNDAKKDLEKFKNMSTEEAEKLIEENYIKEVKRVEESIQEKNLLKTRYEKILAEVRTWQPPTDEHVKLKEYAINQLEESVQWDCSTSHLKHPTKMNPKEWLQTKIEYRKKDIDRYKKEYQVEVERVNERNKWVNDLRESLK